MSLHVSCCKREVGRGVAVLSLMKLSQRCEGTDHYGCTHNRELHKERSYHSLSACGVCQCNCICHDEGQPVRREMGTVGQIGIVEPIQYSDLDTSTIPSVFTTNPIQSIEESFFTGPGIISHDDDEGFEGAEHSDDEEEEM